jgi:hypothetical protein
MSTESNSDLSNSDVSNSGAARDDARADTESIDLFGLRSRPVTGALLTYGVVYVVVTVGSSTSIHSIVRWAGLVVAFLLLAGVLAGLVRIVGDPLPMRAAVGAVVLMVAGTAIAWWSIPPSPDDRLQCLPAAISGIVVVVLVAVRGRLVLAWVGTFAMSLSAGVWGAYRGIGFVTGLSYTSWVYPVMLFATLTAMILRPMADSIRLLRAQELRYAATGAAAAASAAERDRQLARLDSRARPLLEQVAATQWFTAGEVSAARLVEAQLRDGIRASAWQSPRVRDAVWQARERGVTILLLDDGGSVDDGVQRRLDDVLIDELAAVADGRVTARVMPPGRPTLATIVVNAADGTRRYDCTAIGDIVGDRVSVER